MGGGGVVYSRAGDRPERLESSARPRDLSVVVDEFGLARSHDDSLLHMQRDSTHKKKRVGQKAVDDYVKSGYYVGLGTGSTTIHAIERLAEKIRSGELADVVVVPCSVETKKQCIAKGIPISTLSSIQYKSGKNKLDVVIDGADEVDIDMTVLKGGSGGLLREKIVEAASDRVVIVVDDSKLVRHIGPGKPLPVEVIPWDVEYTLKSIESLEELSGCRGLIRRGSVTSFVPDGPAPSVTDNGNYIIDLYFNVPISDPSAAAAALDGIPGVVEHGLFVGYATSILVADDHGGIRVVGDGAMSETPWWGYKPQKSPNERLTIDNRQPQQQQPTTNTPPHPHPHQLPQQQAEEDAEELEHQQQLQMLQQQQRLRDAQLMHDMHSNLLIYSKMKDERKPPPPPPPSTPI